ncbi:alanine dehydrogenase [Patescibacteria group bacterium]|nr:alanine dehydrogenase [Patescibacteria group bacterium]
MIIGVPKEIKENESRVSLIPEYIPILKRNGHEIRVEEGAGRESGFSDHDYEKVGAIVSNNNSVVWSADLIIKVKEPQEIEFKYFRPDLILFTFLHLVAFPVLTKVLLEKKVTAIDYATVELPGGVLPILKPMSEIAGKLAVQKGAQYLEKINGGKGILLDGANVLILGGGNAGKSAAGIALGMGANVIIMEKNTQKHSHIETDLLLEYDAIAYNKLVVMEADEENLKRVVRKLDLLIGATLLVGERAPKIVTEEMVETMEKGSVIVDISIDQGGCIQLSQPTTHKNPVFKKHGVTYYCVSNMPAIVPRTATKALLKETFSYIQYLADSGFKKATTEVSALEKGVNTCGGVITHKGLAKAFGVKHVPLKTFFK